MADGSKAMLQNNLTQHWHPPPTALENLELLARQLPALAGSCQPLPVSVPPAHLHAALPGHSLIGRGRASADRVQRFQPPDHGSRKTRCAAGADSSATAPSSSRARCSASWPGQLAEDAKHGGADWGAAAAAHADESGDGACRQAGTAWATVGCDPSDYLAAAAL